MKKIYLAGIVFFVSNVLLFSQPGSSFLNGHPVNMNGRETNFQRAKTSLDNRGQTNNQSLKSITVDYDGQEAARVGTNYTYFFWDMNNSYTTAGQKYCVVAFDSLFDTPAATAFNYANVLSIKIDSVYALIGHENNSGQNDTIILSVIPVNTAGYPQVASAPLWSDQLITHTGLSTGNDWGGTPYYYHNAANYTLSGTKKFAVMLQYKGSIQDTMAFVAGFEKTAGTCGASSFSVQKPSQFFTTASAKHYANSYALWAQYATSGPLPTPAGSDLYYDCDANNTATYPPDGYSFIQNITIWVKLTIDDVSGINEVTNPAGLQLYQNYPNPANGLTNITYDILQSANVAINIYDLAGKKLIEMNEGRQASGSHTVKMDVSSLASGMYFYTLTAGESKMTKPLTVRK